MRRLTSECAINGLLDIAYRMINTAITEVSGTIRMRICVYAYMHTVLGLVVSVAAVSCLCRSLRLPYTAAVSVG
jgi:hypothetical protein